MKSKPFETPVLVAAFLLSWAAPLESRAAERTILDRAIVIVDPDEPSFVQYGVEELAGYLKETTGNEIPVAASPADAMQKQRKSWSGPRRPNKSFLAISPTKSSARKVICSRPSRRTASST